MRAPRRKAIIERFRNFPDHVQEYFSDFPSLVENDYSLQVSVAYLFSRLETAYNTTIYCGMVKLHKVNTTIAHKAVDEWHMTREGFREKFDVIFGKKLPNDLINKIKMAEEVRDKIAHGKHVKDADMRMGLSHFFEFVVAFDARVQELGGFTPFGDLRGFAGRAEKLPKDTSRWVVLGMGFFRGNQGAQVQGA